MPGLASPDQQVAVVPKEVTPPKAEPKPISQRAKEIFEKIRSGIAGPKPNPDKTLAEIATLPNPESSPSQEATSDLRQDMAGEQQGTQTDNGRSEITELSLEQGDAFGRINENIAALSSRIRRGEGDVDRAKQVLQRLLEAREQLYLDVARSINPDIQKVEGKDNVYRIAGVEIYGSITAVMDATPILSTNRQLAERLKIRLPGNGEVVSGENLPPRSQIEASVVFSGSGAQNRIQYYPGDRDMQEYVRIHASTPEEAASLLARGIQESVYQQLPVSLPNGEEMILHYSEMKLGGNYPEDARLPNGDPKIRWSTVEVKQGYKEYQTTSGEVRRITLEQACLNPQVLKVDYIGVTRDSVMEITKQTIIQDAPEPGDDLMTNDPGQANAFQEVYFDDPADFGLIEATHNPDKFVQYTGVMADQVKLYSASEHLNGLKVLKRLYNLAKAEGDLALSQEVAGVFGTDAAKISQLVDRLSVSMLAQKKGIDVSDQQTVISGQLKELLTGSSSPSAVEALSMLEQGNIQSNFERLREISLSIINSQYQRFLSEHPKVAARINAILRS